MVLVAFDDISYSSEDAGKTFHYTIKEVIPESKAKGMTYDERKYWWDCNCHKRWCKQYTQSFMTYGDKTSFTNKLVTTSIPPTPPTVDKPELKPYSIQLYKVNQKKCSCRCCIWSLWSWWYYSVANPYGAGQATATSDANGLVAFYRIWSKKIMWWKNLLLRGYQLSADVIKVSASELKAATNLVVDKGTVVNKPFTSIPPTPPTVEKLDN